MGIPKNLRPITNLEEFEVALKEAEIKEIDRQIAIDALNAMNVKIDKLTKEQVKYMGSW